MPHSCSGPTANSDKPSSDTSNPSPTTQSSCCDQQAPQELNPVDQVIERLRALSEPLEADETVSLLASRQRVLAQNVYADLNVPPADNSAVDGYAMNTKDFEPGQAYKVSQRIPAGHQPSALEPGTAARIFTGASIPEGANCVIMQEQAELDETAALVSFRSEVQERQNIRPMGQDVKAGQVVLEKGKVITPARMGLLASIGIPEVKVQRKLRVAIFSTGDELVEPGGTPKPSQIFNSNRYLLSGMLSSLNMEIVDLGLIPDQLDATEAALRKASQSADVILSTGGASVGEEDYVQAAIKNLGSIDFWRVAIKPGKPFMYGEINNIPVLGLPGNPGAVFVTFAVLARPFLLHKQGLDKITPLSLQQRLDFSIRKAGPRREFLRVQRSADGQLSRHPNQSSGMLSSASWADGLAVIPEHSQPQQGDNVEFIPFNSLFSLPD